MHWSAALHGPTLSGVFCSTGFLAELIRKFSKSLVLQRHTPFSQVRFQVLLASFRGYVSHFMLKSLSGTYDICSATLMDFIAWGFCACLPRNSGMDYVILEVVYCSRFWCDCMWTCMLLHLKPGTRPERQSLQEQSTRL